MADESTQSAQTDEQTPAAEPHGEAKAPDETPKDWEAEYRKAVEQSRKWEARAKANSTAAKELDEMRKSSMTDAEKVADAEKRAETAEAELQALRDEAQRRIDADEVSAATGVPAALLTADTSTKEGMEAFAKQLAEWAGERQNYPSIADKGSPSNRKNATPMDSFGEFMRKQMR